MNQAAIGLEFVDSQGITFSHDLEHGSYLLVGSSDACTLTIKDRGLSPIHCAVRFERGEVWLEDWQSDAGVYVDGNRIQDETSVSCGRSVRIGELYLEIRSESIESDRHTVPDLCPETRSSSAQLICDSRREISSSSGSNQGLHSRRVPQKHSTEHDVTGDLNVTPHDENFDHSGDDELLHAEIEQLRYELADRDAQLAELTESTESVSSTTPEEEAALLGRLEELLSELDRNDERVAMLEQLLQASEEANRADREERRHLNQWVEDIESRLGEREADWRAENGALEHRVQTLLGERDQLMRPMQLADKDLGEVEIDPREFAQLQAQRDHLQRRLDEAAEEKELVEQELRDRERQLSAREQASDELRREHLQLAQDRAALARQRAEIAAAQAELKTAPRKPETEIDCRLREFRQHLREIHDEEQQSPRTLASRLGQLWNRLDG